MGTGLSKSLTEWLLTIQVVCFIMPSIQPSDDISWKLVTRPAVFGGDIMLECKFPEKICCNKFARRWLGGEGLRLLVMNGASVYPLKYIESFNPDTYTSKLTIHSLNSTDVNVLYACTYGFVKDVKVLELTEDFFESYPSELFEENITTSIENKLLVNISMHQVFPKPNCTASLDENEKKLILTLNLTSLSKDDAFSISNSNIESDISEFIKIFAVMTRLLYAVKINISYQMLASSCPSLFYIVCTVGTKIYEIERNVTCVNYGTSMIDTEKRTWHITFIVLSSIGLVLVFVASVNKYRKT